MDRLAVILNHLAAILNHLALACCNGEDPPETNSGSIEKTAKGINISIKKVARDTVDQLQFADKPGDDLQAIINGIVVQAGGWSEYIAKAVLRLLEALLKTGAPMGTAMREAYNKSSDVAEKLTTFAKDHPVLCTVIALGVLAILAPLVISALGFTAKGVLEDSFAAAWQSTYGGFVEAGSWFSYFQKLGTMVG